MEIKNENSWCFKAAAGEWTDLNVTGHDCYSLGVQAAQVRVLKQLHKVILGGILQRF